MADIQCPYCKESKDEKNDFYWRKEKKQSRCKSCQKLYCKEWNRQNRERLREIKDKHYAKVTAKSELKI